jgi:hypothetical protein
VGALGRLFRKYFLGLCVCSRPLPLRIAAEAGICARCARRLWGEDFNWWN